MAVELWIDDGDPWYLSPDIWVVPGNDPNGLPGIPILNMPSYVWARVHNRGTTGVSNATVRYYWADPSMAITPSTATLIGTSYVNLTPGETKEVLCLTRWIPRTLTNCLDSGSERVDKIGHLCSDGWRRTVPFPL
jgi:hypothetical protein